MRSRTLTGLLLAASAFAANVPDLAAFRELYRSSLERYGIVGSSFALVHNNEVVDREFYGDAVRNSRKVDENTTYHWASITKTFTGIAIMQLRDHGLLNLDDPAVKYVPELRAVHDPFGPVDAIDRKSTRLNSSHQIISYAVFCLKKKNI